MKLENNFKRKIFSKKDSLKLNKYLIEIKEKINKKNNFYYNFNNKFLSEINFKKFKKFKKFKSICIVGMGGSILGMKSIYSFLQDKIDKKIYFLDNLDLNKSKLLIKEKKLKSFLFIFISKSGGTLETLTNINYLGKAILKPSNTIIITEKKKNPLQEFAKKNRFTFVEHRDYIGGRYSVLSEVGLIPSFLLGLNLKELRKNITQFLMGKEKNKLINEALQLSEYYNKKKTSSIIFLNYNSKLSDTIFWIQQLISESLGKKGFGLLPVISECPKDHHSLLQLYLDGPRDKIFYIFSSKKNNKEKKIKNLFGKKLDYLNNKSMDRIITAQKEALIKTLKNKNIPFRKIEINSFSESSLGNIFSYFIFETILLGKLTKVNPFDQPSVEQVKLLTKKILN